MMYLGYMLVFYSYVNVYQSVKKHIDGWKLWDLTNDNGKIMGIYHDISSSWIEPMILRCSHLFPMGNPLGESMKGICLNCLGVP